MGFVAISDTHQHAWSAFSTTNADGTNSRNTIILDETERAAKEGRDAGLNLMVHAGDLFHVRGSIAPSVLNPTLAAYERIVKAGTRVVMIPGNHDMETKDSGVLTNAIQALQGVGVEVCHATTIFHDDKLVMIPWYSTVEALKAAILDAKDMLGADSGNYDLIIHAPIDGVIPGLPDHGLTVDWLAKADFKRVFAGHYHASKDLGRGVYSIGASTHQTWGDVGTKAGFLLVGDDDVNYRASHAPSFIDVTPETDPDDLPLLVDGNYVRAYMEVERESQVAEMREYLVELGAKGVVIHKVKRTATVTRTGSTVKTGASIEASINEYIQSKPFGHKERLNALCTDILNESEVKS